MLKVLFLLLYLTTSALALSPEVRLADDKQEERARNIFLTVRCLVCGGQVIESSNTEFSFGMRKLIRDKIIEGKSDSEIKSELIEKFGSDIITEPGFEMHTVALYFLPLIFAAALMLIYRKSFLDWVRK